jgi:hypothetical protein
MSTNKKWAINSALWKLTYTAVSAPRSSRKYRKRDAKDFFRWLRPRLGAHDYATLIALDPEWIASQDAAALYAEWCGAPHDKR